MLFIIHRFVKIIPWIELKHKTTDYSYFSNEITKEYMNEKPYSIILIENLLEILKICLEIEFDV